MFTDTEFDLLRKGLNFAPLSVPNFFELFIDLNKYIRKLTLQKVFYPKEKWTGYHNSRWA